MIADLKFALRQLRKQSSTKSNSTTIHGLNNYD